MYLTHVCVLICPNFVYNLLFGESLFGEFFIYFAEAAPQFLLHLYAFFFKFRLDLSREVVHLQDLFDYSFVKVEVLAVVRD